MDPSPADRVRALREQHGSHDKLAAALGTSRQRVIDWEKGGQPSPRYRQRLADLAGLPVEAFAYGEQQRPDTTRELVELGRKLDELLDLVRGVRSDPGLPIRLESSLREEVTEANRKLDVLFTHLGVSPDGVGPDVSEDDGPSQPLEESDLRALLAAVRVMLRRLEGLAGPDAARWLDGQVAPEPAQIQER